MIFILSYMLCTRHLVNQLTIIIIVIDKCQKAYCIMTVNVLDCLPANASELWTLN